MKKRPAQESGDSYAGRFPSAWLEILHFVSDRKTPKMPENTVLFIGNAFHDLRGALHFLRFAPEPVGEKVKSDAKL